MVQGPRHGLPAVDSEIVLLDETIDPMLIDDDPGQVLSAPRPKRP